MSRPFQPSPDELWGRPAHAIHIQPHLEAGVQADLVEVQRRAAALWPGRLHLAPANAIHVTIYPLVRVPGTFDRNTYWQAIEAPSRALVAEAVRDAQPLELTFAAVRVMSAGIIVVAEDPSGFIARLRARVVESLPPPPGCEPIRYDLVHATLARFASADPVPRTIVERLEALPVSVRARAERLKLTRETLFPCLATEELGSFPFGRS